MYRLEVGAAVRHIYIYVVRVQKVNTLWLTAQWCRQLFDEATIIDLTRQFLTHCSTP